MCNFTDLKQPKCVWNIWAMVQVTHRFLATHGLQPEPVVILGQSLYSQQRPRPGQRQNTLHISMRQKAETLLLLLLFLRLCHNESMQRIWIFHTDSQRASVFTRAIHKLLRAHEQRALQKESWRTGRLYRVPSRTSCPTRLWFYGRMISVWRIRSRPAKAKNTPRRIARMNTN